MSRLTTAGRALVAALAASLVCGGSGSVFAGDQEDVIARVKSAQEAAAAGDHRKAANEYIAAYRIVPNPNILIAIASEFRELGGHAEARRYLKQFLTETPADHKRRPEAEELLALVEADLAAKGGDKAAVAAPVASPGEEPPAGGGQFAPEAIPLQLDDTEKPVERRARLAKASGQGAGGLPTTEKRRAPGPAPFYTKWWFWALTAVVAGGGVAIGVIAAQPASSTIRPCPNDVIGCYGEGRQ